MVRCRFEAVLAVLIVIAAAWNVWSFHRSVQLLPRRENDALVVLDDEIAPFRSRLQELGYSNSYIAYVTPRSLRGDPKTSEDDLRWVQMRYAMIPWILVQGTLDTSYLIGDFGEANPELPSNLVKVLDSGKGLVLLKRVSP